MNDRNTDTRKRNAKNSGGNTRSGTKKRSKSRGRGGRSKKIDPEKYWGVVDTLPAPSAHVTTTADPSIVATSLGRAPIPGHENASRHYLSLVYERAAGLAVALAAAGGITEWGDDADGPAGETDGLRDADAVDDAGRGRGGAEDDTRTS